MHVFDCCAGGCAQVGDANCVMCELVMGQVQGLLNNSAVLDKINSTAQQVRTPNTFPAATHAAKQSAFDHDSKAQLTEDSSGSFKAVCQVPCVSWACVCLVLFAGVQPAAP